MSQNSNKRQGSFSEVCRWMNQVLAKENMRTWCKDREWDAMQQWRTCDDAQEEVRNVAKWMRKQEDEGEKKNSWYWLVRADATYLIDMRYNHALDEVKELAMCRKSLLFTISYNAMTDVWEYGERVF